MSPHLEIAHDSTSKDKKINHEHIESMKIIDESDIRSIHPDKMEEFVEYLVQKARTNE